MFLLLIIIFYFISPETPVSYAKNSADEYLVGMKKDADVQSILSAKKVKKKFKKKMKKQNTVIVELDEEEVKLLQKDSNVAFIEKNESVSIQTTISSQDTMDNTSMGSEVTPWGNVAIGANMLEENIKQGNGIKVAVLDTGIASHPDLRISGGVSFVEGSTSYSDENGHGTHVAGIISAQHNKEGIVGVATRADLYGIKVLNAAGNGTYAQVIQGIEWAIDNHMNIISMSFTGAADSEALHQVIKQASQAGIILIASAGNLGSGVETEMYPARYPEVVSVGATTQKNVRANLSSTGNELDIMAPGIDIYSTYKNGSYLQMSGTSMAVPYVTGAAAVLWSQDTSKSGQEIVNNLYSNSTPLGSPHDYGHGLVNLAKSLGLINSDIPAYDLGAYDSTQPEVPGGSEVQISAVTRGQLVLVSTTAPSTKSSYTKVDIGIDSPSSTRVCGTTLTGTFNAGSTVPSPAYSCSSSYSWPLGTYTVKFTFYYSGGTVPFQSSFTLTPEAPSLSTSYTSTRTSVNFSWNSVSGVTSYKIIKNGALEAQTSSTSYMMSALSPGSTYNVQVKAVDPSDSNSGAYSNTVPMTTKPALIAPNAPQISNITANSFIATWNAVPDVDQYKILINGALYSSYSSTIATITGLNSNTTYNVQVKAVDKYDPTSTSGATSAPAYPTTLQAPGPADFTATFVTSTTIKVSWSPYPGALSYNLVVNDGSVNTTYSSIQNTYTTVSSLTMGKTYTIKVYSNNASGTSLPSQLTVTTDGAGTLPMTIILIVDGQAVNAHPYKG